MLQEDIITKVLGSSNVCVEDIQESSNVLHLQLSTKVTEQICPRCKAITSRVHDYRLQIIKDLPIHRKEVYLFLKKRRYVCTACGKRFFEKYSFLPRYAHFTSSVYTSILSSLGEKVSLKAIAKQHNVSSKTVTRLLELIGIPSKPKLPTVMGIDEFKGNTNGEKYQVILTDVQHKKVVNILPNRYKSNLTNYFIQYPLIEREKVRVLVMDMWDDYRSLSWLFPNAVVVADKYHWVRQINWALDRARKRVQNNLSHEVRLYFKRFRLLLQKRYTALSDDNKLAAMNIIEKNTDLYNAWQLKEMFYDFKDCRQRKKLRNYCKTLS